MFKKINLILFILSIIFIISGCQDKEKIYNDGDRVVIDGVVYEYDVPLKDEINTKTSYNGQIELNYYANERPYYDYTTANIYASSKPIYHSCYPTDLIHPENTPITSDPFLGNYEETLYSRGYLYNRYYHIEDELGNKSSLKILNTIPFEILDEANSLPGKLYRIEMLFAFPVFWIVDYVGDEKEINIPDNIDGIFVAGIGYGAFHDRNVDNTLKLVVDEIDDSMLDKAKSYLIKGEIPFKKQDFPFFIMPFALNYIDVDITINRDAYIYSRGLNNVNGKFSVNECAMLTDACIYSDSYYDSYLDLSLKEILIPFQLATYGIIKYLPIVNTKIINFSSLNGYMLNEQIYFDRYDLYSPVLIKGYTDTKVMYDKLPKEIYLNRPFVYCFDLTNNQFETYLTDDILMNKLEKIIIGLGIGEKMDINATGMGFYIDNNILYFRHKDFYTQKSCVIKIFDIPKNCKVEVVDYPIY